ncbi:hypothetical protein Tco_0816694 [Tanacetum coccineum]
MDVVEDILYNPTREPRVHVLHDLRTHPTLHLDSDFTLSSDSPRSDLVVSFPSGTRNKILDPGIFIEVQFEKFLSRDEFSISFIRDPLSPVIDTLLSILRTFLSWMFRFSISILLDQLKYGGSSQAQDSVNKNKRFVGLSRMFEASRARGFVLRSLKLHILSFILGIQYPNPID